MTDLLFVYGTLHPDRAPAAMRATVRLLQPAGPATVWGTLHQLGEYPGLIMPGSAPRAVAGHLFRLPAEPGILARLDAYEGFQPDSPAASLFLRIRVTAALPSGAATLCWAYVYNQPITSDLVI